MAAIDLNCDLGESFGIYKIGMDQEVIPYITSANIACGYHAGDPLVMEKTVSLCRMYGVRVGAHPGFPDRMGFGRRDMSITPEEAKAYVLYQVGALKEFCKAQGIPLHHIKLHGALYNMAARDYGLASAVCRALADAEPSVILFALCGSQMIRAAEESGIRYAGEVFADRAYRVDGTLVPRNRPGAMIEDKKLAVSRVIRMVREGMVDSVEGVDIPIRADSVCVHGDGEQALEFVRELRKGLESGGIDVRPFGE